MRVLGATNRDIDFTVATGLEALRQRLEQRFLFWRGDWFVNNSRGVPYLTDVLGRPYNELLLQQTVAAQARSFAEVTRVNSTEVTLARNTRRARIALNLSTIYGDMTLELNIDLGGISGDS